MDGPSALIPVHPPTDFDNGAECCPVMAHARIAVVPEMDELDNLTAVKIREPRVLWQLKPFNEENERLAFKWLKKQVEAQLRRLGTFVPPTPPLLGGHKAKLAFKTIDQATGRAVGGTNLQVLNGHRLSVDEKTKETQRALLGLAAR